MDIEELLCNVFDEVTYETSGLLFDDTSPMFDNNVTESHLCIQELTNLCLQIQTVFDNEVLPQLHWLYDVCSYGYVERFNAELALAYMEFSVPNHQSRTPPSTPTGW